MSYLLSKIAIFGLYMDLSPKWWDIRPRLVGYYNSRRVLLFDSFTKSDDPSTSCDFESPLYAVCPNSIIFRSQLRRTNCSYRLL